MKSLLISTISSDLYPSTSDPSDSISRIGFFAGAIFRSGGGTYLNKSLFYFKAKGILIF